MLPQGSTILIKKSGEDSIRFRESRIGKAESLLKIKGRVTDLQGNPMKDIYVKAYKGKSSQMFKMLYIRTMPEYMVKTDDQGYYAINVGEKGTYYIIARELIGEAPAKGEYYGLYEDNANHAVVLEKDSIGSINIVVSRIMTDGESQESEVISRKSEEKKQNREHIRTVKVENRLYNKDTVINRDTEWSGYVVINGTVYVARSATLTISPGTTVLFRRIDKNRDGVGDGKIRVSGRLIAEGTHDKTIRFTSAEDPPNKMDWSYVLFFASGNENVIKYCIFEYAFTGVQAHFSRAVMSDSVFTKNHEGIRFGRTELQINNNDIFSNSYGIRYTRLEGPVEITYNNIRNNDVGIFHVPSNQNIVNFSDTFVKKENFHSHQPVIRYNNISFNKEYNFRLGERQGYNILLKDNWWSSTEDNIILDTIYDEKMDDTLGTVMFKPYFIAPVKKAGIRRGG
jgi:hypothetical protein